MLVSYARPPITEAVIAFEFATSIGKESLQKVIGRLTKRYSFADEENATSITIDTKTGKSSTAQNWAGAKLSSVDRADVALCRPTHFVCSRLAPYSSWEPLRDRALTDWKIWKGVVGPEPIRRIGVRYVNRIDIPPGLVKTEDYLNFAPRLPEGPDVHISAYAMQVVRPLGSDDLKVIINSATVPSPLVGYASLGLDIDVFRDENVPVRDEEIWSLIEKMRVQKNLIFERCITDRARELFKT